MVAGVLLIATSGVLVLAAPVHRIEIYGTYNISCAANPGLSIDIPWGDVNPPPALWYKELSNRNQKWTPGRNGSDVMLYSTITIGSHGGQFVMQFDGSKFVLRNEYNANISLTRLDFNTLGGTGNYRILLRNSGLFMAVNGAGLGQQIRTQSYNESSSLQKWYVEYA